MPKPSKYIHAKDKPRELKNHRKQEINRNPTEQPQGIPQNNHPIEANASSMIFFLVLNAELLKFGSRIKTHHPRQYENNSQSFFMKDKQIYKHREKVVKTHRETDFSFKNK